MEKWNLIIDVARCENCNNCVLATKDEYCGNDFPGYSAAQPRHGQEWIKITRRVRGEAPMVDTAYLVETCNHCDNAPCVEASQNGAVFKRDDGVVLIDPSKAKGQKEIVASCPYGAIFWNEELGLPQKWTFDAHLLDQGWKEPRCTQACPTESIRALKVEDEEMARIAEREKLETLRPEANTKPRVYYKNLSRFSKNFIGGSVVGIIDGVEECIKDATVSLVKDGQEIQSMTTDDFGDFKFDQIANDGSSYLVMINHGVLGSLTKEVISGKNEYLGALVLVA